MDGTLYPQCYQEGMAMVLRNGLENFNESWRYLELLMSRKTADSYNEALRILS